MGQNAEPAPDIDWKMVFIVCLGSMLEVYDFLIYAMMAPYISRLFFPSELLTSSLILTFGTFAVGYLSRPLGGILFGHQGDRRGRKKPFSFTIVIMALATLLMGCLPGYDDIGYLAPLLLVLLRLVQGLAMGGETGGALTYISEHMPAHIGKGSGALIGGMCAGLLLGYLVHNILLFFYGPEGMLERGWRVAFWFGAMLGIIGYIIRLRFQETLMFRRLQASKQIASVPLLTVLKHYPRQVICGALAIVSHSITVMLLTVFLQSWLQINRGGEVIATVSTITAAMMAVVMLPCGYLYDRKGREYCFRLATVCHLMVGLPWYYLVVTVPNLTWLTMPMFSLLVGFMAAAQITVVSSLFPTRVRYTGVALSYNLGFLAGGFTPLVSTWLVEWSGQPWTPGVLLTLAGVTSWLVRLLFRPAQEC
ncbi:MAG: MFS transporter [Endozoicomonas sp.]